MWYRKVLGKKFREDRFILFNNKINKLTKPIDILDIGGTYKFWENMGFVKKLNPDNGITITLFNLKKEKVHHSSFISFEGNATDLSEYSDNQYDIVFSNSVIEHLFTYENQIKMANEIMRVGKNYFIQTPNKYFPIEPHYFFPFFQFMSFSMKKMFMMKTKFVLGKYHDEKSVQRAHEEIRLLSRKELEKLFMNGIIHREKILGFTKSFMVMNF